MEKLNKMEALSKHQYMNPRYNMDEDRQINVINVTGDPRKRISVDTKKNKMLIKEIPTLTRTEPRQKSNQKREGVQAPTTKLKVPTRVEDHEEEKIPIRQDPELPQDALPEDGETEDQNNPVPSIK